MVADPSGLGVSNLPLAAPHGAPSITGFATNMNEVRDTLKNLRITRGTTEQATNVKLSRANDVDDHDAAAFNQELLRQRLIEDSDLARGRNEIRRQQFIQDERRQNAFKMQKTYMLQNNQSYGHQNEPGDARFYSVASASVSTLVPPIPPRTEKIRNQITASSSRGNSPAGGMFTSSCQLPSRAGRGVASSQSSRYPSPYNQQQPAAAAAGGTSSAQAFDNYSEDGASSSDYYRVPPTTCNSMQAAPPGAPPVPSRTTKPPTPPPYNAAVKRMSPQQPLPKCSGNCSCPYCPSRAPGYQLAHANERILMALCESGDGFLHSLPKMARSDFGQSSQNSSFYYGYPDNLPPRASEDPQFTPPVIRDNRRMNLAQVEEAMRAISPVSSEMSSAAFSDSQGEYCGMDTSAAGSGGYMALPSKPPPPYLRVVQEDSHPNPPPPVPPKKAPPPYVPQIPNQHKQQSPPPNHSTHKSSTLKSPDPPPNEYDLPPSHTDDRATEESREPPKTETLSTEEGSSPSPVTLGGSSSRHRNSPRAYKFYMEQHMENVVSFPIQRERRKHLVEQEASGLPVAEREKQLLVFQRSESELLRKRRGKIRAADFVQLDKLGTGAFGEVRLVRYREDRLLYAMKLLNKAHILKKNQAGHVRAERDILAQADNEWVVRLLCSFQDKDNLYLVMEYVPGGDLMSLLIAKDYFDEPMARFYTAEMVLAIDSVHQLGFLHRDIKPDNILIDRNGHIKLTDFGLCTGFKWTHDSKYYQNGHLQDFNFEVDHEEWERLVNEKCNCCQSDAAACKPLDKYKRLQRHRCLAHSLVGTPNYIAPELLMKVAYDKTCDWWSVGVILYEMVLGRPPFWADSPADTQLRVLNWRETLVIPREGFYPISEACVDFISRLCTDARDRLGAGGVDEIKRHPFLACLPLDSIRQSRAPYVPEIRHDTDTQHFQSEDTPVGDVRGGSEYHPEHTLRHPDHAFYEFTYRRPNAASLSHFTSQSGGANLPKSKSIGSGLSSRFFFKSHTNLAAAAGGDVPAAAAEKKSNLEGKLTNLISRDKSAFKKKTTRDVMRSGGKLRTWRSTENMVDGGGAVSSDSGISPRSATDSPTQTDPARGLLLTNGGGHASRSTSVESVVASGGGQSADLTQGANSHGGGGGSRSSFNAAAIDQSHDDDDDDDECFV